MKTTHRHNIVKVMNFREKEENLKSRLRKMVCSKNNNKTDCCLLSRNNGNQKRVE